MIFWFSDDTSFTLYSVLHLHNYWAWTKVSRKPNWIKKKEDLQ